MGEIRNHDLHPPKFKKPFRIGRKNKRAILDAYGRELIVFPKRLELIAMDYARFLNETERL